MFGRYLSHIFIMTYAVIITIVASIGLVSIVKNSKPEPVIEVNIYDDITAITQDPTIAMSIVKWGNALEVDPYLIVSIMKYESNFNVYAVNENTNGSFDRGLMQLNSSVYGNEINFFDIDFNIQLGTSNLAWCLEKTDNNVIKALAYYNCGIWRVQNNRVPEMTLDYISKVYNYYVDIKGY